MGVLLGGGVETGNNDFVAVDLTRDGFVMGRLEEAPKHFQGGGVGPAGAGGDARGAEIADGELGREAGQAGCAVNPFAEAAVDGVIGHALPETDAATIALEIKSDRCEAGRILGEGEGFAVDGGGGVRGRAAGSERQGESGEGGLELGMRGVVRTQRRVFHGGEEVVPDEIYFALHVAGFGVDGDDGVLFGQDDGELAEGAVAAEAVMAAAPELVAIALVPIAGLLEFFEIAARAGTLLDLEGGGLVDPGGGNDLAVVPTALAQI